MVRINVWQLFRQLDLTKYGEKFADISKLAFVGFADAVCVSGIGFDG
jgi:hypothetical protein